MGSRGVSRPQRQASSGVTYKEIDDGDDVFVPNARSSVDVVGRRSSLRSSVVEDLGVAKGRRTLTLKKARILVEPPVSVAKKSIDACEIAVAKESMDVYDIAETALEEKPELSSDHRRQFLQVVEDMPAEVMPNLHKESSAFEYLLEAVSGASGDGEEEGGSTRQPSSAAHTTGQSESRSEQEERTTSAAYDRDILAAYDLELLDMNGVKEEDAEETNVLRRLAHSSDEVQENRLVNPSIGKGTEDTVKTEGYKKGEQDDMCSADEMKDSKRGEENKQDNMSSANEEEEMEDDDEAEAEDSWNGSSDASDAENKSSVKERNNTLSPAKKPSIALKTYVKTAKVSKKDLGSAGCVSVSAKSTSVPPLLPKKWPALWVGTKTCASPGGTPLNLPSPSMAHRRVVGLSRRHRPPPLHPYLLGS